jgi:hypothetical protein
MTSYYSIGNIDPIPLLTAYSSIEKDINWLLNNRDGRQCGLQYREGEDPFTSATGKFNPNVSENEYNLINPLFQNTIFEEIIKKYKLVRTRLMWAGPRTCYSLHRDTSKRLHIPLITNEQCLFVFPEPTELFHLPLGQVFIVDTTKTHSFCNFSDKLRLHLMGCVNL